MSFVINCLFEPIMEGAEPPEAFVAADFRFEGRADDFPDDFEDFVGFADFGIEKREIVKRIGEKGREKK